MHLLKLYWKYFIDRKHTVHVNIFERIHLGSIKVLNNVIQQCRSLAHDFIFCLAGWKHVFACVRNNMFFDK